MTEHGPESAYRPRPPQEEQAGDVENVESFADSPTALAIILETIKAGDSVGESYLALSELGYRSGTGAKLTSNIILSWVTRKFGSLEKNRSTIINSLTQQTASLTPDEWDKVKKVVTKIRNSRAAKAKMGRPVGTPKSKESSNTNERLEADFRRLIVSRAQLDLRARNTFFKVDAPFAVINLLKTSVRKSEDKTLITDASGNVFMIPTVNVSIDASGDQEYVKEKYAAGKRMLTVLENLAKAGQAFETFPKDADSETITRVQLSLPKTLRRRGTKKLADRQPQLVFDRYFVQTKAS